MNNYTEILRAHNLKATPQRLAIADALHISGHLDIGALYEILSNKFSSLSLATIYKNINLMQENSFIQEVKIPHSKSVYELSKEYHSHLVCLECKIVEDIVLDLNIVIQTAKQKSNFSIKSTDLVLSGFCQNCK